MNPFDDWLDEGDLPPFNRWRGAGGRFIPLPGMVVEIEYEGKKSEEVIGTMLPGMQPGEPSPNVSDGGCGCCSEVYKVIRWRWVSSATMLYAHNRWVASDKTG